MNEKMMKNAFIVWFRRDLRVHDNPVLVAALASKKPVLAVFIKDFSGKGGRPFGAASRWWLHHSLHFLQNSLHQIGLPLHLLNGDCHKLILSLALKNGAGTVAWNATHEPCQDRLDRLLQNDLQKAGIAVQIHHSFLLKNPAEFLNNSGRPYQVFTPFYKKLLTSDVHPCVSIKLKKVEPERVLRIKSCELSEFNLLPKIPWDEGFYQFWKPGEDHAQRQFAEFLDRPVLNYQVDRDRPERVGTSRLSASLRFGEISPRFVWHETRRRLASRCDSASRLGCETFLKEIVWRDFAYHLLHHFPTMPEKPLAKKFEKFPWQKNQSALSAWQRGLTGFPIVDAGMRELWKTGWMHNRVRMIVGSFLVKDLMISWREGESWFWDTLVDADPANNPMNWQWVAGCGADAAPFFRIFNPILQGEKFDPEGAYVKRWIPELRNLPPRWIHRPWLAPPDLLTAANIEIEKTYPSPLVDHAIARERALLAFKKL